jgi:group II intron reverse transcriptase/maturase
MSTELSRLSELATADKTRRFLSIAHLVTPTALMAAFEGLRKDASAGVDGVTYGEYEQDVWRNIPALHHRLVSHQYRAQPLRRVYIPKENGKQRPISIPALEDKLVQKATVTVLNAIYEQDFLPCSYGFRPGLSPHDALDAIGRTVCRGPMAYVLEADIQGYFDAIVRSQLMAFVERRIGDSSLLRLIRKWIHVGVIEDGRLRVTETGTGQGQVISPLLANIYLHYVLDLWVRSWRKRQAHGEMYVVRYADDFVMAFQREEDARAMRSALAERLAKFGLELHPGKTRVIEFGRNAQRDREQRGLSKPETFEFLGFVHIARTDTKGGFQLKRYTSRKKRRAKLASLKEEAERRRHHRVVEQQAWLSRVLDGHYRYYGVPNNSRYLQKFRKAVYRMWLRSLQRRSQRARMTVDARRAFAKRFPLPRPRIHHPWPSQRFALRRP